MKKKHKVTTEVYKKILEIEKELPPIQKYLGGKPLFRTLQKLVNGSDIPDEHKEQLKVDGVFYNNKRYFQKIQDPILVNHKLILIEEFEKHGQEGIDYYISDIQALVDRAKSLEKVSA